MCLTTVSLVASEDSNTLLSTIELLGSAIGYLYIEGVMLRSGEQITLYAAILCIRRRQVFYKSVLNHWTNFVVL